MHGRRRWTAVAAIAVLSLSACSKSGSGGEADSGPPVKLVPVSGTDLHRVVLTKTAVDRIGLETEAVADAPAARPGRRETVIPYAALLYDPSGATWVYASVGPRTFQRAAVTIDRIDGDDALVSKGPPAGTQVVTVAAAEVYGSEFLSEHE